MNDQFNDQKDYLTSLKHEISLLQQQVDYLIRNKKAIGLLDLDVLMNRTHTIYDQLCSINVGTSAADDEDLDIDPGMINAFFGLDENNETAEETPQDNQENEETEAIETPLETEAPVTTDDESSLEEEEPEKPVEDYGFIFKMEPEELGVRSEELGVRSEEEPVQQINNSTIQQINNSTNQQLNNSSTGLLDFGEELEEKKNNVYTTGDEIEMVIPHFDFPAFEDEEKEETNEEETNEEETNEEETFEEEIPEEDQIEEETPEEEETLEEEPIEETFQEEEEIAIQEEEPIETITEEETEESFMEEVVPEEMIPEENISEDTIPEENIPEETNTDAVIPETETKEEADDDFQYEPIIFGNMEENEEVGFEIETPETLGERMQHEEDHSLAAKLQHQSVPSLRSAIGINDKFLLVNELFSGSMEKYNRSIENLDDLKTLNGALIYLNELRIELQWNSNNEAYKKLLDLVHRKFEA